MLLRSFSKDTAGSALRIIILFLVIWLLSSPGRGNGASIHGISDMPFYGYISKLFDETTVLLPAIVALIWLVFQSFLLIRLNVRHILMQERSFLPGFFFLVISSVYMPALQLSSAMMGVFFILLLLDLLLGVDRQSEDSMVFFNAGLLLGVSSMFYAPALYYIAFVWIVAAILRAFFWRDYLLPLLGAATPFALYAGIAYLAGNDPSAIFIRLKEALGGNAPSVQVEWKLLILLGFLVIILSISSIYMLGVYQFRKVYIRNYYLVLFWLFLVSAGIFFLTGMEKGLLLFLAVPMSFLFSNYFINSRKKRMNALLLGTFLLLLIARGLTEYFGWF
jgi:hypothetical protein